MEFTDRGLLLTGTVLNEGFSLAKLKCSFQKSSGRHHDLVKSYATSVSQMTTYMFHLSEALPGTIPHSSFITGFVSRVTRLMPLVE